MPLLKAVNYTHLFPTRYALELEGLKGTVSAETFKEPSQREDAKKTIKKLLEDRYTAGKNKWFFTPLRVRSLSLFLLFPNSHLRSALGLIRTRSLTGVSTITVLGSFLLFTIASLSSYMPNMYRIRSQYESSAFLTGKKHTISPLIHSNPFIESDL